MRGEGEGTHWVSNSWHQCSADLACQPYTNQSPQNDPLLCHSGWNKAINMLYLYYIRKIRDSGQQHPIRPVRQNRNADWRESWATPWKAKCLDKAWEAFPIPDSSSFTNYSPTLHWLKMDLMAQLQGSSNFQRNETFPTNLKGKGGFVCLSCSSMLWWCRRTWNLHWGHL